MHPLPPRSLALLALLTALALPPAAVAQPSFTEVTPASDPWWATPEEEDFWVNAIAPADVDLDGDLDLAVLGFYVVYFESVEDVLLLFLNQGEGAGGEWSFTAVEVPLGGVVAGASDLAWGDLDGDGDHDLAVGSEGATVLYRNDAGTLVPLAAGLPGYWEDSGYTGTYDLRSLTWADFDNDGDLDLLVPSVFDPDLFEYRTALMENDGPDGAGGWTFTDAAAAIDATSHAQSAWADAEGDGDLDLFLANVDPFLETGFVRLYRNDAGAFTGEELLGITINYGLADQGDYDLDGDLDLLVTGNIQEVDGTYDTVLRVYRNEGGTYVEDTLVSSPNADWLDLHAATWADYDSDGDVDLLVTGNFVGEGEIVGKSEVFGNEGGVLSPLGVELAAPIDSIGRGGSFTWLDLDGDGDLDYLVAGAYYVPGGNGLVEARMRLYENGAPVANAAPGPPSGLLADPEGAGVRLSWIPATDDHTPFDALTYELALWPAGQPPAASVKLPEPGNLSAVTSWPIAGLPDGDYAWSLRAVDSAFNGGAAATGTFSIPAAEVIFRDGFEIGDTSAWSSATP